MPRSVPLFLFPALLSGLLAASLAGACAWAFRLPTPSELAETLATSESEGERVAAVEGLAGDPGNRDAIVAALSDRSDAVRLAAAVALARAGDAKGLDVLLARADDASPSVRMRAIMALSILDVPSARQRVERAAAEDPDPSVQALARSLRSR